MKTHASDETPREVHALLDAALAGADPGAALETHWPAELRGRTCRVVAAGKAAPTMLAGVVERGLCDVSRALCIGVPGSAAIVRALGTPVDAYDADHPLPTRRNVEAAQQVVAFVATPRPGDQPLVVLLSGGASALLTLPRPPLQLEDCRAVTHALLRAGAPIGPLNCVRKHLEVLKGGGLARLAAPAAGAVWTLVLSDVIGDDPATIASGPACADPTTFADALRVLERYGAMNASPAATRYLREGAAGKHPETVKPGDPVLAAVRHHIIANNRSALDAAAACAARRGYEVVGIEPGVTGEAREAGRRFAARAIRLRGECRRPSALLMGGETTVTVTGTGRGGRNQELALAAAIELGGAAGVVIAAFSTDGVDGATDAAGAFTTPTSLATAAAAGVNAHECLDRNDSFRFFEASGGLLRTGPTGTNVNDVAVALLLPE